MTTSAIYLRSSKDLHNVSCKSQEDKLRKTVSDNGEALYRVFCDEACSSTRDIRPEFDEMISLAMSKPPPFAKIYCLDTSRFGRDHQESQLILYQLRKKQGIEVIFDNLPNTGTYLDPVFETIFQGFDYLHSQQSKAKGVAGMKENVKKGYGAGGRAPYGYYNQKKKLDIYRNGDKITKTYLEPDPETAPIAKELFERRAKGEARKAIVEDFYNRGILSPSGRRRWADTSIKSMEDNIDTYIGTRTFNKANEKIKENGRPSGYLGGKKFKPKSEWVIKENAHDPLITENIASKIREIKTKGIREPSGRAKQVYALSGILKCSECGNNYGGDSGFYCCSARNRKGEKCQNNAISKDAFESAIHTVINKKVLNFKDVQSVIDRLKDKLQSGNTDTLPLEKNLAKLDKRQQRLKDLYIKGLCELEEIEPDMNSIKEQKKAIEEQIESQKATTGSFDISDSEIRSAIDNFNEDVNHADAKVRKRAIQACFDEIIIYPKKGEEWERMIEVKGVKLPLTRVSMASPRGFEPLSPA